MKDRISTELIDTPLGRALRYAEYDRNGVFVQHRYLIADDAPIEEGTSINKANLLDDYVGPLFNLDDNSPDLTKKATVNNAFRKIPPYKVGDIITTMRNDLSEKWLYCNGAFASRTEYPLLLGVLPKKYENFVLLDRATHFPILSSITTSISGIKFIDGKFVAICSGGVHYSTDGVNWVGVPIAQYSFNDIDFDGTYWVAIAGTRLYYSKSLSGPWTQHGSTFSGGKLSFLNGYWFLTTSSNIYYTASPVGSWATIAGASYNIEYRDGWFVSAGGPSGIKGINGDPGGTWQQLATFSGHTFGICKYEDTWITSQGYCKGPPDGTWVEKTIPNITSGMSIIPTSEGIFYARQAAGVNTIIGYSSPFDPTKDFVETTIPITTSGTAVNLSHGVAIANGKVVVPAGAAGVFVTDVSSYSFKLPSIAIGANAYILAKEL